MPFRFHLKHARRYEVSSKKSYVVCVHLLDNKLIECTLTSDSSGYDCLENLAQRIELNEVDYFGLRYVNKKLQMRWLDLDKPIKKQLDKHAHSPLLYFGLLFYIRDTHLIQDSMTRYQFFLQVKSDVIEDKLPCSTKEAVVLAALSLQAEFGDHDYEHHTAEFLKELIILPRSMTADDKSLAELTQDVIAAHRKLQGVQTLAAELRYIREAQQLESYGAEFYPMKDEKGRDYLLGVSYMGISVKDLNGRPSIYFRWSDIVNLTQNKRVFGINGMGSNRTIEFYMDDSEIAKYVFRMCSLQHQFYKATHSADTDHVNSGHIKTSIDNSQGDIPDIQKSTQNGVTNVNPPQMLSQTVATEVTTYEDPSQTTLTNESTIDVPRTYELAYHSPPVPNGHMTESPYENASVFNAVDNFPASSQQPHVNPNPSSSLGNLATQHHPGNGNMTTSQVLAPAYRAAPDYNSVMQQRMEQLKQQQQQQQSRQMEEVHLTNMANLGHAQVYNNPELMAYSQPEIGHTPPTYNQHISQSGVGMLHRSAGLHHPEQRVASSSYYPSRPVDRTSSLIIHPTYSTPDLAMRAVMPGHMSTSENHINNTEALLNQLKPPPPYPSPRPSNSYPDLATHTLRSNYSNSPDLVSHHQNLNLQGQPQNSNLVSLSRFDQSVENLALDAQVLSLNQQTATHSKQFLDDASSTHSEYMMQTSRYNAGSYTDVSSSAMHTSQPQLTEVFIVDPPNAQQMTATQPPPPHSFQPQPMTATQPPPPQYSQSQQLSQHMLPQQQLSQPQQMLEQLQRDKQEIARRQELLEKQQQELLLQQSALTAGESMLSPSSDDTMIVHSPNPLSDPPSTPEFLNPEHLETLTVSPDRLDYSDGDSPHYISPSHFIGTDNPMYRENDNEDSSLHTPDSSSIPYEAENSVSDMSLSPAVSPASHASHTSHSNPHTSSPRQPDVTNVTQHGRQTSNVSQSASVSSGESEDEAGRRLSMGPMKMAALNGLTSAGAMLDPLPTLSDDSRIPKDERRKAMENKQDEGQVFVEFEQVPKKRARYEVAVSSQPHNKERNRFKDVLPYDDNRVKLTPTKVNPQGYINASHIRMTIAGRDWWYIAAQGPLPSTTLDFWQMVWEQEVEVVAMLTGITEHGRAKCQKYWPDEKGPKHALKFGDYQVSLKFFKVTGPYVTNGLILYNKRLKRERLVWHLQYTEWPDHGCPDDPMPFLDYLNALEAVRRQRLMEKRDVQTIPVLVHCSAGVGRTGVTILSELMKACFEYNEVADVPEVLFRLREQRMYMVQTVSQYSFVYQALVEYLKGSRLI